MYEIGFLTLHLQQAFFAIINRRAINGILKMPIPLSFLLL